jgi:hypothetical protein
VTGCAAHVGDVCVAMHHIVLSGSSLSLSGQQQRRDAGCDGGCGWLEWAAEVRWVTFIGVGWDESEWSRQRAVSWCDVPVATSLCTHSKTPGGPRQWASYPGQSSYNPTSEHWRRESTHRIV